MKSCDKNISKTRNVTFTFKIFNEIYKNVKSFLKSYGF